MASTDIEYDEVVVNLKVLASVSVNSKLYTRGSFLNIEQNSLIPEGIRRWYHRDNRDESIKKIDRIITKSLFYIPKFPLVAKYLIESKTGLLNMKETYSLCIQTVARLDTIIAKIDANTSTITIV
mgnify:FL=1|tara:strand:- start:534 stop:908 length:375 start_codon:yes stop_codon:yes gene_type:complete